jgi:hypothetical protein
VRYGTLQAEPEGAAAPPGHLDAAGAAAAAFCPRRRLALGVWRGQVWTRSLQAAQPSLLQALGGLRVRPAAQDPSPAAPAPPTC